ncbi:MAG: AAA family ATPase [Ferrovibrio sp.]|uniref:AAA family ATPase n=1 Tax=Ferrovibrio sp. TaxID=1917215 RepID=UPI00262354E5|nr:AAA family ATPase [Ferrovibrio sp.]MCW0235828.1 AAA family ATPase [Ferrovibrio sp.]
MQFTKLRLSGFKSFVEPTDFVIHPGLTGIVGPNGCGKSNLVEALRWVMGENSAKRMRGTGMDDMIFAGTATRPARNIAEVTLTLDNATRTAPAAFNEQEMVEITRKIEREKGSDYSINGNDVRMRDVQLLFADLASGANSPAMVSQGRVGAIINAKPTDRRMLLEEAAGISGLHSRRHEAELRLKAAEQNLERVVDVIGQLDNQLQSLKRQARQASRYRNIAGQIRKTEATLFHLKHDALKHALAEAEQALQAAEREVADRTLQVSEAHESERVAAEALPPLRQHEAEAGARLHRLTVAREGLDAESARAQEAAEQVRARLAQIGSDAERESALSQDAEETVARLAAETGELEAQRAGEAEAQTAAEAGVSEAQGRVDASQAELDTLTDRAAEEQAQRARLRQAIEDAGRRLERLNARLAELSAEEQRLQEQTEALAEAETANAEVEAKQAAVETVRTALDGIEAEHAAKIDAARQAYEAVEAEQARLIETARAALEAVEAEHAQKIDAARAALAQAGAEHEQKIEAARGGLNAVEAEHAQKIEAARAGLNAVEAEHAEKIAAARGGVEAAEAARAAKQQAEQTSREAWQGAQGELTRLKAEETGLTKLLKLDESNLFPPLIDQVTVEPGFEKALGAALADELNAATDPNAPMHWDALPPLTDAPALPFGAEPLSKFVTGAAALQRRLSQIGLVADDADGARLRADLKLGQRLVTKSGALWRWDGFTVKAGAPTSASIKLEQRNRLADLREELRDLEGRLREAQAAYEEARRATEEAAVAERAARQAVAAAEETRNAARQQAANVVQTAEQNRAEARSAASGIVQAAERAAAEARDQASAVVQTAERERQAARDRANQGVVAAERDRNTAREHATGAIAATERERHAARERANQDIARADRELGQARDRQAEMVRKEAERQSRLAALAEQKQQTGSEIAEAEQARSAEEAALAAMPAEDEVRQLIGMLRDEVNALRQVLVERRAALEQLRLDAQARARRLDAIVIERRAANARNESASQQLAQLGARQAEASAELEKLEQIPREIESRRSALLEQISVAETARREAADHLANAEAAQQLAAKTAREIEQLLGTGREARVKAESDLEHQRVSLDELAIRVREVLDCTLDAVLKAGEVEDDEEFPELHVVENRLERLRKERDNMGPVNLRAELEANEVEEKLTALSTEQTDLVSAIEKLRQGITSLNKEGRERLLEAFQKVDSHFQKLFVEVFGGGKAHLQLVESDDPLQAGLEIYASPPGKRLQVMSLLSGGEQALTALSLLFAVFLTNPAPICVLDEVDAPLDDANVERLCNLMEAMARQTSSIGEGTRFVVVTHHPITMARMDRLFGVTMAERGVSTLVSVDLAGVNELKAIA